MKVLDLGRKAYVEVWELQKELLAKRAADECEDTLILVEHDAVYTVGRAVTDAGSIVKVPGLAEVPVVEVERGGKMTFHGPGQLVGYPIFKLTHKDLRRYLQDIERVLIHSILNESGLAVKPCAESLLLEPGQLQTGVWMHDRKIASIGIAVKSWVSYHGFALNFSTDLRYFQAIEPCGFSGSVISSVDKELKDSGFAGAYADVHADIKAAIISGFAKLSEEYQSVVPTDVLVAEAHAPVLGEFSV